MDFLWKDENFSLYMFLEFEKYETICYWLYPTAPKWFQIYLHNSLCYLDTLFHYLSASSLFAGDLLYFNDLSLYFYLRIRCVVLFYHEISKKDYIYTWINRRFWISVANTSSFYRISILHSRWNSKLLPITRCSHNTPLHVHFRSRSYLIY